MSRNMTRAFLCGLSSMLVVGCSQLGSMQTTISANPLPPDNTEVALIGVLSEAYTPDGGDADRIVLRSDPGDGEIARYLTAGFALTDIYCDRFFRSTSVARQRRTFGRTLSNDVGAAVAAVLGLAGAPASIVAGAATATGLSDSSWRNYDSAFVVAPELANVRRLVMAAQDDYRARVFATRSLPSEYATARSHIVRYAGLCTYLGMQAMLNESVEQQRRTLVDADPPQQPQAGQAPPADGNADGTKPAVPVNQASDQGASPAARTESLATPPG